MVLAILFFVLRDEIISRITFIACGHPRPKGDGRESDAGYYFNIPNRYLIVFVIFVCSNSYDWMKGKRILKGVLIGIAVLLAAVLIALKAVMTPKYLTKIVRDVASEYIEGDLAFNEVRASVLRSFPFLNVTIDDCSLTYPHDRYSRFDSLRTDSTSRFSLVNAGRAEVADTLASFRKFSASVNYLSFIKKKKVDIHAVELKHPRIFAHYFDSTAASWDILPIGKNEDDTTKTPLPEIEVKKIELTERPFIVFTDPADTLFGLLTMRDIRFNGLVKTNEIENSTIGLKADSMFVSGRLPKDTIAVAIDRLGLEGGKENMDIKTDARLFMATGSFGRIAVPVSLAASGNLPEREDGATAISIKSMDLKVTSLEMTGNGDVVLYPDSTFIKAEALIDNCPLGELVEEFKDNFPFLKKIKTDAKISLDAICDGYYNPSRKTLPDLIGEIVIPKAYVDYEGLGRKAFLGLNATAETDENMKLDLDVSELLLDIVGIQLKASGGAESLLGDDPIFKLDGYINSRVDSLTRAFTASRGISGTGSLKGSLKGTAKLSQLNMANIGNADIKGDISISQLHIDDAPDTIKAFVPKGNIIIETKGNKIDSNLKKGARVLAVDAALDTVDVRIKDNMFIRSGKLALQAQNSAALLRSGVKAMTPFIGNVSSKNLSIRDNSDMLLTIDNTRETFRITPASGQTPAKFRLTSSNDKVGFSETKSRISGNNLSFDLSASMHKTVARERRERRSDRQRELPVWLQDKEFRSHDISIDLGESISKYLKEWEISGNLKLDEGVYMTPSFPLINRLQSIDGDFTNDNIDLKKATVISGDSDITGKIAIKGLRRILTSKRGIIGLDAKLSSEKIDVNEIMNAFAYRKLHKNEELSENVTTKELESKIRNTEIPDSTVSSILVIPANIDATVSIEANSVLYDSLHVTWAASEIALKQRCLQITNTIAESNMGDIYFEGFYSTKTRNDIKAGFDLNMVDITAEKVITLMPAVDTILPMLQSFSGMLDCELVATSDIDQKMNLILPSIDGVMKISGSNLTLDNNEQFAQIAKYLLFRNKKKAVVDKMSVEGVLRENTLEVFPFVLNIDRYTLAASGIQHLDESFKYHISGIKTPIPIKFGINVYGTDFDHLKFKLGRALYPSTKIPVFTTELNAVQYNLIESIHNIFDLGVEKAIEKNKSQTLVEDKKARDGYSTESGELSATEMAEIEKARNNPTDEEQ